MLNKFSPMDIRPKSSAPPTIDPAKIKHLLQLIDSQDPIPSLPHKRLNMPAFSLKTLPDAPIISNDLSLSSISNHSNVFFKFSSQKKKSPHKVENNPIKIEIIQTPRNPHFHPTKITRTGSVIARYKKSPRAKSTVPSTFVDFQNNIQCELGANSILKLVNYEKMAPKLISRLVKNLFNNAPEGSIIELPGRHITLNSLKITNPISVRGTPGTTLEIRNGNIQFAFNKPYFTSDENSIMTSQKATFSECTIFFNLDLEKWCNSTPHDSHNSMIKLLNGSNYIALIDIHDQTFVEFRDCDIRAVISKTGTYMDDSIISKNEFGIKEIGFWLNQKWGQMNESIDLTDSYKNQCLSTLSLKSCIFTHLYSGIMAGPNTTISIDRCYFSECRFDCLNFVNPNALKIANSNLSKNNGTGIKIEFSNSLEKNMTRNILIDKNIITENNGNGILLNSTDFYEPHNLKIQLSQNRILSNKKEGCKFSSISLKSLEILSNDFRENTGSNLFLESIHQNSEKSEFVVQKNNFIKSASGFGVFSSDFSGKILESNFEQNSEGGLIIRFNHKTDLEISQEIQNFNKIDQNELEIFKCTISENKNNGIVIQEFIKGKINIRNSIVSSNEMYGIYLSQCDKSLLNTNSATIYIYDSYIGKNEHSGIFLSKIPLEIHNSTFMENQKFAIHILKKKYYSYLKFIPFDRIKEKLIGEIGGEWGTINLTETQNSCMPNTNCLLL